MNKDKISFQEIIDLIASKAMVSTQISEEFLKAMISTVEEALMAGDFVKINTFGTFQLLWNEPRKNENAQNIDEISLPGYYKVIFIPEATFKDEVNEPFAHLEPVELDIDSDLHVTEEISEFSDQMRLFSEQVSEIKNILSEIKSLSDSLKAVDSVNQPEEQEQTFAVSAESEKDGTNTFLDEKDLSSEIISEEQVQSSEKVVDFPDETKPKEIQTIFQATTENPEKQLVSEDVETKSHKIGLWLLLILFVLAGTGTGLYFLYPPAQELADDAYLESKNTIQKIAENLSIPNTINTVLGWFFYVPVEIPQPHTVFIPKDTTSNDTVKRDTLNDLYKEFIGSERIKLNSRLTTLSKQYYGNSIFWVYIYEANKKVIPNPENIPIGTLIKIPKVDPRLIDSNNKQCILKAKELNDLYLKPVR
jgi:nucleoid DNA-binding protein